MLSYIIIKNYYMLIYSNYIYQNNYNYISSIILINLKLYCYKVIKGGRGMLELLELACPTACTCLSKLRPGV